LDRRYPLRDAASAPFAVHDARASTIFDEDIARMCVCGFLEGSNLFA
jgi:hypothetical protein